MPTVTVTVYTEYVWDCPHCGYENKEGIDYEKVVQCANCAGEYNSVSCIANDGY